MSDCMFGVLQCNTSAVDKKQWELITAMKCLNVTENKIRFYDHSDKDFIAFIAQSPV